MEAEIAGSALSLVTILLGKLPYEGKNCDSSEEVLQRAGCL